MTDKTCITCQSWKRKFKSISRKFELGRCSKLPEKIFISIQERFYPSEKIIYTSATDGCDLHERKP